MKHLRFILLALVFAAGLFGQPAPVFTPYAVKIGDTTYTVLGADTVNGYRVSTPDGRVIGIPAADPEVKLTASALTAALTTPAAPSVPVHRILKDTLIQRVKAAGKLTELRGIIAGLDDDARFEWVNSSWFSSNNALIVQGVAALGLDAAVILAADPLAP